MFFHVVMPIGSNPDKIHHQKVISDVASEYGISPHFPLYAIDNPTFDLQATLQDMKQCEFVLANLSLERPSCYYELGLAEAIGKPVYLIAIEGTDIHQTASRKLVQFYNTNEELVGLLRDIISSSIR